MHNDQEHGGVDTVHLPSPTAWPMVLALGIALLCTGLVTNIFIGLLGLLLALCSSVGWFLQIFPVESHVDVPVEFEEVQIVSSRTMIERLPADPMHRKMLPIETFRISTGIKGGIAGGIAMIVPATLYSLVRYHSVWYAANLLAVSGAVFPFASGLHAGLLSHLGNGLVYARNARALDRLATAAEGQRAWPAEGQRPRLKS